METEVHPLDDDSPLTMPDGTPYTAEQRYGFFVGLADHIAKQYMWDRINVYPKIGDQLDMLWHAMDEDPSKRLEPFYSAIKAVKDQFPKPV